MSSLTTQQPARSRHVRLVVFPGGHNWPIWVAQEQGYLADNGIDLEVTPTPGSVFQLTGLIEGRFDLAITLIDNVVAYREGEVVVGVHSRVPACGILDLRLVQSRGGIRHCPSQYAWRASGCRRGRASGQALNN